MPKIRSTIRTDIGRADDGTRFWSVIIAIVIAKILKVTRTVVHRYTRVEYCVDVCRIGRVPTPSQIIAKCIEYISQNLCVHILEGIITVCSVRTSGRLLAICVVNLTCADTSEVHWISSITRTIPRVYRQRWLTCTCHSSVAVFNVRNTSTALDQVVFNRVIISLDHDTRRFNADIAAYGPIEPSRTGRTAWVARS